MNRLNHRNEERYRHCQQCCGWRTISHLTCAEKQRSNLWNSYNRNGGMVSSHWNLEQQAKSNTIRIRVWAKSPLLERSDAIPCRDNCFCYQGRWCAKHSLYLRTKKSNQPDTRCGYVPNREIRNTAKRQAGKEIVFSFPVIQIDSWRLNKTHAKAE